MLFLLILIHLVLFSSAFLSICEASVISMPLVKAKMISKREGTKSAIKLEKLIANKEKYLSTIIILNTIVNVAGSTFIGSVALTVLDDTANLIMTILFTAAVLYGAEMIPKLYAAIHYERLIPYLVKPLILLSVIIMPFLWLSRKICKPFTKGNVRPVVTLADINFMISTAKDEGLIKHRESEIIHNIFTLGEKKAKDAMVEATELESIKELDMLCENADKIINCEHRRLVVTNEAGENVGMVKKVDLLSSLVSRCPGARVRDYMHPIYKVSPETPLTRILMDLDKSEEHLLVVEDEAGNVLGALAIEDILHRIAEGFEEHMDIDLEVTSI